MDDQGTEVEHADAFATPTAWDRLARSYGYRFSWDGASDTARIEDEAALQVEVALRSLALAARGRSVSCVVRGLPRDRGQANTGNAHAGPASMRLWPENAEGVAPETAPDVAFTLSGLGDLKAAADPFANPVKRMLAETAPLWLDALRQWRTDRLNRSLGQRLRSAGGADTGGDVAASKPTALARTVLISVHWLDFGGAESFAIETMEAAVRAGFEVVVTCDRASNPRLLARARRWSNAIYMLDAFPTLMSGAEMVQRVLARHRPAVLHIQHSALAYAALPALRRSPDRPYVLDTLHILEHRTGGFVADSVTASRFIDRHHVVSHQLARVMAATGAVAAGKLRVGKLHDMSRAVAPDAGKWRDVDRWRVVFIGRFMQQKRPALFIEIAARLRRRLGRAAFYFEMMGEGELLPGCKRLSGRRGLADDLTYRPGNAGAVTVLAPAHVLLIPSDNEGLTLVAYEAMRADCLVVSCDVGAQSEIVLPEMVVPRAPLACVSHMTRLVADLRTGRSDAEALLDRQRNRLAATLSEPTGLMACDYAELVRERDRGALKSP